VPGFKWKCWMRDPSLEFIGLPTADLAVWHTVRAWSRLRLSREQLHEMAVMRGSKLSHSESCTHEFEFSVSTFSNQRGRPSASWKKAKAKTFSSHTVSSCNHLLSPCSRVLQGWSVVCSSTTTSCARSSCRYYNRAKGK
jgi:hypothetical protein